MSPTMSRRVRRALGVCAGAAAAAYALRAASLAASDASFIWRGHRDGGVGSPVGGSEEGGHRERDDDDDDDRRDALVDELLGRDDVDAVCGEGTPSAPGQHARRARGSSSSQSLRSGSDHERGDSTHGGSELGGESGSSHSETPNFFASTKFFACLELEESQELFEAAEEFRVNPNAVIFRQGDDSSSGIYIVVEGAVGVYLQESEETGDRERNGGGGGQTHRPTPAGFPFLGPPFLTNILREGESVGDVDVLDNAPRGVSCIAMEQGARLVRIRQDVLMAFIRRHPHTLQVYLHQAIARLWRVAHFVLVDFLGLPHGAAGDAVSLVDPNAPADSEAGKVTEEKTKLETQVSWPSGGGGTGGGGVDEEKGTYEPATEAEHTKLKPPSATPRASTKWPPPRLDTRASSPPPTSSSASPGRVSQAALLLRHLPDLIACCPQVKVPEDGMLYAEGEQADDMLLMLSGAARADAVPWPKGNGARGPIAHAPALIGGSAFLTRSARQETLRVVCDASSSSDTLGSDEKEKNEEDKCVVLSIGASALAALKERSPAAFIATLLAASCSLSHLLRRFISLGLNRVWLSAGEAAYVEGEEATSMYFLISGRIRLVKKEDDGGSAGAYYDPAIGGGGGGGGGSGNRDRRAAEERGRGETIGEAPLLAGGRYPSTAMCLRDSELVRMSKGALNLVCARNPTAASRLLEAMARKLHATLKGTPPRPDIVTIVLVPASRGSDAAAVAALAADLRRALRCFGPTLWLDERAAQEVFKDGTIGRLASKFYRSKLTGWMAQQEENYRFILLQADAAASPWSQLCVSQADRILVVAHASTGDPAPQPHEQRLLWRRRQGATTELIMLHGHGESPRRLRRWRECRPEVVRHHSMRLGVDDDLQRLARHIAGHAVGVVLTGGGGHGLAHLGALRALEDSGIPVDCVGGTSQGALMAALYARHASTTHMLPQVKDLVRVLSSPRHLLTDLTLPVLSIFSGKGVDSILQAVLGETDIEDMWLSFFCCSTNLTSGRLSTHTSGTVWRYVRASMTVLGLLPPVYDNGELLVDGGYLNSIPVDVMQERMGVETVIVVDVEDNDYLAFRNLTPHDGGLGGWRLLWERINPFGSWFARWFMGDQIGAPETSRAGMTYGSLLNALMYATSMNNLSQATQEHRINLYLRPPGVSSWVAPLTPARVDALVRRAHRYSCGAIAEWQRTAPGSSVRGGKSVDGHATAVDNAVPTSAAVGAGSASRVIASSQVAQLTGPIFLGDNSTRTAAGVRNIMPNAVGKARTATAAYQSRNASTAADAAHTAKKAERRLSATLPPAPPGQPGLPPPPGQCWSLGGGPVELGRYRTATDPGTPLTVIAANFSAAAARVVEARGVESGFARSASGADSFATANSKSRSSTDSDGSQRVLSPSPDGLETHAPQMQETQQVAMGKVTVSSDATAFSYLRSELYKSSAAATTTSSMATPSKNDRKPHSVDQPSHHGRSRSDGTDNIHSGFGALDTTYEDCFDARYSSQFYADRRRRRSITRDGGDGAESAVGLPVCGALVDRKMKAELEWSRRARRVKFGNRREDGVERSSQDRIFCRRSLSAGDLAEATFCHAA